MTSKTTFLLTGSILSGKGGKTKRFKVLLKETIAYKARTEAYEKIREISAKNNKALIVGTFHYQKDIFFGLAKVTTISQGISYNPFAKRQFEFLDIPTENKKKK